MTISTPNFPRFTLASLPSHSQASDSTNPADSHSKITQFLPRCFIAIAAVLQLLQTEETLASPSTFQTPKVLPVIQSDQASFRPEVLVSGLDHLWGMDFMPNGQILVTERSGTLRVIEPLEDGRYRVSAPVDRLPDIWTGGQGGLLDVAWHDGLVYFSYAEPGTIPMTNSTAVARARLITDASGRYRLTNVQRLFTQSPKYLSRAHFGSRLVFDDEGHLFITLGERYLARDDAQTLDNHHGKIVRINLDGSIPADNPYKDQPNALAGIWSIGHRNIQGAALHPQTRQLWIHEHGPKGGDELNLIKPGNNYGWPVITYGEEYVGGSIGEGTRKSGMEQPVHYWVPSIAPSGMAFYNNSTATNSSHAFAQWDGDLFVGSLKFRQLVRLEMNGNSVIEEERIALPTINQRIRDVAVGSDGYIYLLTDDDNGQMLRLIPQMDTE